MPDVFVAPEKETQDGEIQQSQTGDVKTDNTPIKTSPKVELLKQGNHVHIFSSLCQYPDDITFENQENNEKVILFIRRDFITNLGWMLMGAILIVLPIIFLIIQKSVSFSFSFNFIPINFIIVFLLFYYLIVLTYLYISFITWFFNISLVTDTRIVDVDFSNVIYKNVSSTKLDLIQDVSFSQVGVIRTFFDYGDILVQTAGTLDNFEFSAAPQPENVVHIIGDLIGRGGSGV